MKHCYHVAYQYQAMIGSGFGSTQITYNDEPNITSGLLRQMNKDIQRNFSGDASIVILNVIPLMVQDVDVALNDLLK